MRKANLINADITSAIALMGEGDTIAVVGACEPIPAGTKRIDLALIKGVPSFETVMEALLSEFEVKEIAVPIDIYENSTVNDYIESKFSGLPKAELMPEQFRIMLSDCKAVIRTGDTVPKTGIILTSKAL